MNKYTLSLIGALVILGAIVGGYYYPNSTEVTQVTNSYGAVGDTYNTSKIAETILDLSTTTPTTVGGSCTLYNADSKDRIITSVERYYAGIGTITGIGGAGIAAWTSIMSTSTGIYNASSVNYILNTTVATSSAYLYEASSTPGTVTTPQFRVWGSGTCLNLFNNATSSSATGSVVVKYFISQ